MPGCRVIDDFNTALGDPTEALLSTAVAYAETGSCPAGTIPQEKFTGDAVQRRTTDSEFDLLNDRRLQAREIAYTRRISP